MIDTIIVHIRVKHKPFGDILYLQKNDDKWITVKNSNRVAISNYIDQQKFCIYARSIQHGSIIELQGNPHKFYQGHNIAGSNNMRKIATSMVLHLLSRLGIKPTEKELAAIKDGEIVLKRVDVNGCTLLESNAQVNDVCKALKIWAAQTETKSAFFGNPPSVYFDLGKGNPTLKFYGKHAEIKRNKRDNTALMSMLSRHPLKDQVKLDSLLERMLRFEVVASYKILKRYNLDKVKNWKSNTPRELLNRGLSRVNPEWKIINGVVPELEQIKAPYKTTFALHRVGLDPKTFLENRVTYNKHRNYLKQYHGVDIAQSALENEFDLKLSEILKPENFHMGYPKVLKRMKLVHLWPNLITGADSLIF